MNEYAETPDALKKRFLEAKKERLRHLCDEIARTEEMSWIEFAAEWSVELLRKQTNQGESVQGSWAVACNLAGLGNRHRHGRNDPTLQKRGDTVTIKLDTFYPYAADLERAVFSPLGYDCRAQCEHEKKGDHGVRCDELIFVVRSAGATEIAAALSLGCGTNALKGKPGYPSKDVIRTYDLTLHKAFPTSEGDIREQRPSPCALLPDGMCYFLDSTSALQADAVWSDEFAKALAGAPFDREYLAERAFAVEGLWERLGAEFRERYNKALNQAAQAPERCPTCEGKGLVPKSENKQQSEKP